jgi:hypothetical protein
MDEAFDGVRDILDQISCGKSVPEADWSKIRDIDFRESIQERDDLRSRLDELDCPTDGDDFDELVRFVLLGGLVGFRRMTVAVASNSPCRRGSAGEDIQVREVCVVLGLRLLSRHSQSASRNLGPESRALARL